MFRTIPVSIIRSFSLYVQQWYMLYRFADSCEQDQDGTAVFYAYDSLLCHNKVISFIITLLFKSRAAVQVYRKRAYEREHLL